MEVTDLTGHRLRVQLAHVSAGVVCLDILHRQLPPVTDLFKIHRLQQWRVLAVVAVLVAILIAAFVVVVVAAAAAAAAVDKWLAVDRAANAYAGVTRNDGFVDC